MTRIKPVKRLVLRETRLPGIVHSCRPAYNMLVKAIHNDMVVITGPPSVGKRTLALKVFEENKRILHAYVNCYSITTPTNFFSVICQAFQNGLNISKSDLTKYKISEVGRAVASHEFNRYFRGYSKVARKKNIDKLYVLLDHVEAFQKTNLMDCFTALVSIRNLNIIITTYELPIDIVHYATRVSITAGIRVQDKIMPVVVPTWSQADTTEWILSFPPYEETEVYKKFVTNVVAAAYTSDYRNPTETLLFCQDHFEDFLNFYKQRLQSGFTKSVTGAFLRSFSSTIKLKKDTKDWSASDFEIKIPPNTAILIVAAYVAAYTKPSDDKKNFVRLQKRTKQKDNKPDYISRPFSFERLYHIFKALQRILLGQDSDHCIYDNGFILGDCERLENLNILIHQSGWSVHPEAKYKLSPCVKRDYVGRLAKNNLLELDYLHGLSNN